MLRGDLKIVNHASNKHRSSVPRFPEGLSDPLFATPALELVLVERNLATWVAVTIRDNVLHFVLSTFSKG